MARSKNKDRPAGLSAIAEATGYSIATVSHALNGSGRVSPDTREKIRKVASNFGYETPRKRRSRDSVARTIAVVLSANLHEDQTPNYYVGELLAGVESAASQLGVEVKIGFWDEQRPAILAGKNLGGVLYLGGDFEPEAIRDIPTPGVIVGSYLPGLEMPAVLADNRAGTYLATKALINSGCRQLALANGQEAAPTSGDKLLGFYDAVREAGLGVNPRNIIHEDFSIAGGVRAGRVLLGHGDVDGIVTGDDPIAMGIIQVAWKNGIDIPGQVSIIGYGDGAMSRDTEPALSTVQVYRREMAKAAVELLLSGRDLNAPGSRRVYLRPSLTLRNTTRPAA